ncbi:anthranilate phosphoribosyltransferase, chloroplastic-like protein [Tanacetum coccineum]
MPSLIERKNLTEIEAEESLDILLHDANEALISAFLVPLRAKGETYEEIDTKKMMAALLNVKLRIYRSSAISEERVTGIAIETVS